MNVRDWLAQRLMIGAGRLSGLAPEQARSLTLAALAQQYGFPIRGGQRGRNLPPVNNQTALTNSVVWACRRIRADLLSTFPVDSYRDVDGVAVEVPNAPILVNPDGSEWPIHSWMWAGQFDLDGLGNTVGRIAEKNALGLPSRIELYPAQSVSIRKLARDDTYTYKLDGTEYRPDQVWHMRQFPIPGLPVGLSPIQLAAAEIQGALSFQQFALDWFAGGGMPKAHLRNTRKSLDQGAAPGQQTEARRVKDRYMATISNGDVFVSGFDWELDFLQAQQMGTEWLQGAQASIPALCRYFGCPVDLVEAAIASAGSNINYTNGLQRNLQFLTYHLQPAIYRWEHALSALLPRPRYVKLNTNSLQRLDPLTQAQIIGQRIKDRTLTNAEARAKYDLPPLTPDQIEEFATVYGSRAQLPADPSQQSADGQARNLISEWASPLSAIPYPHPDDLGVTR